MTSFKGYFYILGATMFWGISATIAKSLFTQHIDPLILVQMRVTISFIFFILFFLIYRPGILAIQKKDIYRFVLLGIIGGAGSNFTYYFTIQQTNVATAILLQYMAPLLVFGYAAVSGDERLTSVKITAGIISLIGCVLALLGKNFSILTINQAGLFTGILSAFCWAFTNVYLRHLLKIYSVWTILLYTFFFASLFWTFFSPPWNIFSAGYTAQDWKMFFFIAVTSVLIPHSLYFNGVRYLTPTRAIITATSEPIVAILSAFIILNETLNGIQIIGAACVITAIAVLQMNGREEPNQ